MPNPVNDDLFSESTMTFGEHLEELRGALFRSLIGLMIGFLIACFVANRIVQWIQVPLIDALEEYYHENAVNEIKKKYPSETLPPEVQRMVDAGYAPDSSMMIEPVSLLEQLRRDYPGKFDAIDITAHIFTPKDFFVTEERLTGDVEVDRTIDFARHWRDQAQAASITPGKEMWQRLGASQRQTVEQIAAKDEADANDRAALVMLLNDLVRENDLHTSKAFAAIASAAPSDDSEEKSPGFFSRLRAFFGGETNRPTKDVIAELRKERDEKGDQFSADDAQRLNQFLIASHFANEIRPPRVNVVELNTWKRIQVRVIALNAQEVFMIWIKAALVAGAVIASPYVFWQIWMFVAAGLYPHEKNYVYLYLPISLGLFIAGAALAFFFVFKPVLGFLFTFNRAMNIDPDPRIGEWLGFVLFLPLGFGVSFQLPLVMLFLNRIGIVSLNMYIEKWRIAILIIFVISMVLTPADPISMLLMAVPLTILYFGGILMCKYMPRSRNPFDEGYEPS
jgi:sec-independent protein translocase protein TatC